MKVLISDYRNAFTQEYELSQQAITGLCEADVSLCAYEDEQFLDFLHNTDVLITAYLKIDESFLRKAPHLKAISISASGYSNCDLEALARHQITLMHIKEYCSREVSEHALSLLMSLNRRLPFYKNDVDHEHWQYQEFPMKTLDRSSVTIYGFGHIGKITASLCHALGMKVSIVDPFVQKAAYPIVSKETGTQADFIISHMPLTKTNSHYFNDAFFQAMPSTSFFINVARGGLVDEAALVKALDEHKIAGAGLDVLSEENPDLHNHPLLHRDNVILTPHAAFYSTASIQRLFTIAGKNAAYYLRNEPDRIQEIVRGK